MNGTTYNQLIIFHAIANENSVSKAAQKLEMAPPSVSNALKALEKELGLPLFTRTTRRIELTEAGALLYERTLASVNELNFAVESIGDLSKVPSGKVRLTVPKFVYQHMLKPIYGKFCRRYPNIELEISVSDAAIDILKDGFDLGIRFGDRVEPEMVARQLTKPMVEAYFASPQYIKEHGVPQTPNELEQHKLIQYRFITSNQIAPLLLNNNGETLTVDVPNALVVNDTDVMLDAALQGLGIGRMVAPIIEPYLEDGQLMPILKDYWYPYSPLYVYFHRNTQKAKRVRVLIDFLLEELAS
ncbi:LysR family transcriptional regulator [Psychrobium sp. MM17-31]|uniref:LysR family transcriptional regulator n=1 Tax=Psychrobium sp. MM17-31 TaxID=2917758 RepID=UPI001EF57C9F|nr:LysR family transcriptional regulator [Psychrobium sp. MM17-31]MCG7532777.1 LysR family transcriptional regulator [Psychrobium sp. MM17-31]